MKCKILFPGKKDISVCCVMRFGVEGAVYTDGVLVKSRQSSTACLIISCAVQNSLLNVG